MPTSAVRYLRPLALLLAAGCGGGGPALVPVRGVVTLDGQPVVNAAVVFVAQTPGGRDAYASTNETGAFRLSTFKPEDGAFPGEYKVVIQPPGTDGGSTPFDDTDKAPRPKGKAARADRIPIRYTVPGQTPLTQKVPAAGDVAFDLKSR